MKTNQTRFILGCNAVRISINYIGSKYRLLPFIMETILDTVGDVSDLAFAELFAGTGIVSRAFKGKVRQLIANDLETYSYVLNRNYLDNKFSFEYDELLTELNSLNGKEGLIYQTYCLGGGSGRQYFSDENGRRIDAIRSTIADWRRHKVINEDAYYFLLASLLESADKVANTAVVYTAFLKHLKKSAQQRLALEPALFEPSSRHNQVYQMDANQLIRQISGDILYLDPPYNHRQYGANYHLLNTIVLYDDFIPRGKTGLREYNRSNYCRPSTAAEALEDIIASAQFRHIFLSYNTEGIIPTAQIERIMEKYGKYSFRKQANQRFKADNDNNRRYKARQIEEYLHILVKL